ncbi:hypothetical protein [Ureibacillus manganicus]|uniref:SLH domain-containing protein n=1 Tax=Ureibacillus manganicus DSM 26584 TaxID=1384049 RepID=A0A0A3I5G9_9BACL|nr:hypothetical protein [Ureibacillus manganicus]KGR80046.1 hypothetical protein CD29_03585 [Ureibacillus manganicus DSM 26584]
MSKRILGLLTIATVLTTGVFVVDTLLESKEVQASNIQSEASELKYISSANVGAGKNANIQYNDFDLKQYWADDMLWMINNGYITGYINQNHPTTKKYGTWLDPNGKLTEEQALSILLRYQYDLAGYEHMKSKNFTNSYKWSDMDYITAELQGIINGPSNLTVESNGYFSINTSSSSDDNRSKQITRGSLAQLLVSMRYGSEDITLDEAVQFMFKNKITSGTNPKKGATLENYAPEMKLTRAHISTFLKKYHDSISSENVVEIARFVGDAKPFVPPAILQTTVPVTSPVLLEQDPNLLTLVPKKLKTPDVIGNKVKTKFGERSYGTNTQAEYDELMKVIEQNTRDGNYSKFKSDYKYIKYLDQAFEDVFYKEKKAITDKRNPEYRTPYNLALLAAEDIYENFGDSIKTFEEYKRVSDSLTILGNSSYYDPSKGVANGAVSAYDLVVNGLYSGSSSSYYTSAVLDQVGIESVVIHSTKLSTSDQVAFKLYDKWYLMDGGLKEVTVDYLTKNSHIRYAPNGGVEALSPILHAIYYPIN